MPIMRKSELSYQGIYKGESGLFFDHSNATAEAAILMVVHGWRVMVHLGFFLFKLQNFLLPCTRNEKIQRFNTPHDVWQQNGVKGGTLFNALSYNWYIYITEGKVS